MPCLRRPFAAPEHCFRPEPLSHARRLRGGGGGGGGATLTELACRPFSRSRQVGMSFQSVGTRAARTMQTLYS